MASIVAPGRRFRAFSGLRSGPQPYCQVCFAPHTCPEVVHDRKTKRKVLVRRCPRCGYVELPGNVEAGEGVASASRRRRGRGRALARIGIDVVGKPDPLVVILSGDRPCPDQDPHRYDVVVAPDLVDGFADPQVEFARMFRLVAADGVVICSAHLYDGGDLSVRPYVFGRGHASYYTRDALDRIASAHELQVDVRIPEAGNSPPSRKRYVIFSRSAVVMASVEAHFSQAAPPTSRATPRRASALAADRGSTRPNALA